MIVIVGGTTGLGLAAAKAFVEEGAALVLVGRHPETAFTAEKAIGTACRTLVGDAMEPATAQAAIELAIRDLGKFDALYHVAGGSGRRMGDGPLHSISDEGWRQTFDLNLTSLFYSNRAAIEQFLKQNTAGAILNMTSVLAYSPSPTHFHTHAYAAAKAAIIGLTKSAAAYYAGNNIRINAIAPALTKTPMSERAQENDEIMDFIKTKQPLDGGRIGLPEDLNEAAILLLGDGGRFITGQTLAVDGGWSISDGQIPALGTAG